MAVASAGPYATVTGKLVEFGFYNVECFFHYCACLPSRPRKKVVYETGVVLLLLLCGDDV